MYFPLPTRDAIAIYHLEICKSIFRRFSIVITVLCGGELHVRGIISIHITKVCFLALEPKGVHCLAVERQAQVAAPPCK
jgi:hypothetical protein